MRICPKGLIGTGQDTPLYIGVPGPKRDISKMGGGDGGG